MKHPILLPLLLVATAFGSTTMYSVEPIDMAHSAFVVAALEDFVAAADTIQQAAVFLGAPQADGDWVARILDASGNPLGQPRSRSAASCTAYSFVHFVFSPPIAVRKGTKCRLEVYHSSGSAVTQVFWNQGMYAYGQMTTEGGSFGNPYPPPNNNSDLAARIEGVTWNNPGMIGMYDWIPCQLFDTIMRHRGGGPVHNRRGCIGDTGRKWQLDSLRMDAVSMHQMGVGSVRYMGNWDSHNFRGCFLTAFRSAV